MVPGVDHAGAVEEDRSGEFALGRLGEVAAGLAGRVDQGQRHAVEAARSSAARCSCGSRSTTKRRRATRCSSAERSPRHQVESLPSGRRLAPIFESVVGDRVVGAHQPEQSGDHDDLLARCRGQGRRIEVIPHDAGVALPGRQRACAEQRAVGGPGSQQVLTLHAEELLVATADRSERVDDLETALGERRAECTGLGSPTGTSGAAALGLPLRRRQQQHWNNVRKSCPDAGHGTTLASTVENMRVHLDAEKCQGHNRCYALAPELFDVDDYGQAMLLVEGDVPAELQDKARLAAANCPEYAITITENG